jgi:acyl-CoA synthetase (AMP-forming)/AMP-acid ligase II/cytochrome P450/acyl carrier protein
LSNLDLIERLATWAATRPQRGFEFVRPEGPVRMLGYAQLHDEVRRLATRLHALPVGAPVLLLLDAGPEFVRGFLACIHARVVPVPLHPPVDSRSAEKLAGVVARAKPKAVLANAVMLRRVARAAWAETLAAIDVDAFDEPSDPRGLVEPDTTLFLQFTSGSTADPKGVRVTHGNLACNVAQIRPVFGSDSDDARPVFWLPPQHDMGLIGGVLMPIVEGVTTTVMTPLDFLRSPRAWLELIGSRRATISGGPNFAYAYATERITDEQLDGLDLSSWRVAFCGAEPVQAATLRAFADRFAPVGFRESSFAPCYGLAEATLFVSGSRLNEQPSVASFDRAALEQGIAEPRLDAARTLVGCGPIADALELAIVDPDQARELPEGRVGEIWVQGDNVAAGYVGDEALSEAVFHATIGGRSGAWLRTGDLGFVRAGELWITGRRKDLIIVRGRNIHPQDVEAAVATVVPSPIPSAVAFAVPGDAGERLFVVCGVGKQVDGATVVAAIRAEVARALEVEVDTVVLVSRRAIPRTTSGKLQRARTRQMWIDGTLEQPLHVAGPSEAPTRIQLVPGELAGKDRPARTTALLDALVRQIAALAKLDPTAIDPDREIVGFGLDSLQLVELKLALDRWVGREFELDRFLDRPSTRRVAELAAALLDAPTETIAYPPLDPAPAPESIGQAPPGPVGDRTLLTRFVRDPFAFLSGLIAEHGEVVQFELGRQRIHLVADPEAVQAILVDRASEFGKGDAYQVLARLMGGGLVTSPTNEAWREQRRAAQPLFGKQTIDDYTPALIERTRAMLARWDRRLDEPLDALDELRHLALEFVLGELLGLRETGAADFEQLFALVCRIEDGIDIPSTFYALDDRFDAEAQQQSRFGQAIVELGVLIDRLIADHLARGEAQDDFITLLARTTWVAEGGEQHARTALRDGVISLIFAGVGTSSSAIFWALHLLSTHADALARVEAELAATLGDEPPDERTLRRCPELAAVIHETLRLYPPIWWINREALVDTRIADWAVPRGTTIFISPWACHHNPRRWPEPDAFRPQRFLDVRDATRLPGFLPFGLGRRACIGGRLSIQQMAVILPMLLQRHRFHPLDRGPLSLATTLSLVPRQRVRFTLEPRGGA